MLIHFLCRCQRLNKTYPFINEAVEWARVANAEMRDKIRALGEQENVQIQQLDDVILNDLCIDVPSESSDVGECKVISPPQWHSEKSDRFVIIKSAKICYFKYGLLSGMLTALWLAISCYLSKHSQWSYRRQVL